MEGFSYTLLDEWWTARRLAGHGTSQRYQASKETEVHTWSRVFATGFEWKVEYRARQWDIDANDTSNRLAWGPDIYLPYIRGWAQWEQRAINGAEERRNHKPMCL